MLINLFSIVNMKLLYSCNDERITTGGTRQKAENYANLLQNDHRRFALHTLSFVPDNTQFTPVRRFCSEVRFPDDGSILIYL